MHEAKYWLAPVDNPIPIHKKIYANSSGSFIGVLNLTIDKAPTNPSDSASDDFTTAIIIVVLILNIGKTLANELGLLITFDWYLYTLDSMNESMKDKVIDKIKEPIEMLIDSEDKSNKYLLGNCKFSSILS